ncbi:MAG TPA: DUF1080 domain-containing protein [Saprospiraceae bacterium]|nr:DUF1080 domain-containing protein [Saprospiraceae bacterium]
MCLSQSMVEMAPQNWESYGGAKTSFEHFDGAQTVRLEGKIFAKEILLDQGTIEVDVYSNSKRSFAGIVFRKAGHHMEDIYLRMHKSRQPDALQYTPVFNGESSWQLYHEYQANVPFNQEGWNKLKVIFKESVALVYVNDVMVLKVEELRTDNHLGAIGLFSLFENRFAHFRYSPLTVEISDHSIPEPKPETDGVITQWQITEAKAFFETTSVPDNLETINYTLVKTEPSGLLTISKFLKKPSFGNFEANDEAFTICRHEWSETKKTTKVFSFDYSDKISIFLNGNLIFSGDNAFQSKGVQFMGHLNIGANKLHLPLKKGKNVIHCIVIDKANGWGLMGRIY